MIKIIWTLGTCDLSEGMPKTLEIEVQMMQR